MNALKEKRKACSRANLKSDKLVAERRRLKLSEIFDVLDEDCDNEISMARGIE